MLPLGLNNAYINRFEFLNKEKESTFGLNRISLGARTVNPTTGRMDGIDPLAEKNHFESSYVFVRNNPLKYIDPDGRDGILVIKSNNITISSNIYIYGSGATRATASQMQSDIISKWDRGFSVQGSNGNAFSVKFDVKVGLYGGKEKNNPLVVPESWNPNNRDNFVEVGASLSEVGRSFVSGGDEGEWRGVGRNGMSLSKDDPAPHEFGHILGLDDRYDDKNGAFKGWEKNIMGDSQNGNVEHRNVQSIVGDAMKAYDTWSKDKNNAGKEFRYEINVDKPNKEKQ
jgi:RHS repeat-associated protein